MDDPTGPSPFPAWSPHPLLDEMTAAPPPPAPLPEAPASPPRRRGRRLVVPAVTVTLSLVAGFAGGLIARDQPAPSSSPLVAAQPASLTTSGGAIDVAGVIAAVEPAVVSIETTVQVRQGPFVREGQGAGTGVVIDRTGHILTNAHVVADATSITVTVNGRARSATLVASDTGADIAVVKVADTTGLVAASVAAGTAAVGDEVVAIGNALALDGGLTVTRGIVSALDRDITTSNGSLRGLIQTDAAISSGNSGGPLVNAAGQVVGINTAVAASSGGIEASNIGFVIPIETAMRVANRLLGSV